MSVCMHTDFPAAALETPSLFVFINMTELQADILLFLV